jgi:uncharacterized membrane protein YccC
MTDNPPPESTIEDEFRSLGTNLVETLRSLWDSPERKKVQEEIEQGLAQLAETLKSEADTFKQSPTGQRLQSDLDELGKRVRTGEAESAAREEILKALRLINTELGKAAEQIKRRP